jgi:hypothetical protein
VVGVVGLAEDNVAGYNRTDQLYKISEKITRRSR